MSKSTTQSALSVFGKGSSTTTKKVYPRLPDPDGEVGRMVDARAQKKLDIDMLTGEMKHIDGSFKEACYDEWLKINEDADIPQDTIECIGKGGVARVSIKSQYWDVNLDGTPESDIRHAEIKRVLGAGYDTYIDKKFLLSVDGSAIPPASKDAFLGELAGLLSKHGADPAEAVKAKEVLSIKNPKQFHTDRHGIYSPEENRTLHGLWSCATAIRSSKG